MILTSEPQVGHPVVAGVTLAAAALGAIAAVLEPYGHPPQLAGLTPDDLNAWVKTVCNAIFTIVNTIVGCYHLLTLGQASLKRRRKAAARKHRDVPRGPGTDDVAPGASTGAA